MKLWLEYRIVRMLKKKRRKSTVSIEDVYCSSLQIYDVNGRLLIDNVI